MKKIFSCPRMKRKPPELRAVRSWELSWQAWRWPWWRGFRLLNRDTASLRVASGTHRNLLGKTSAGEGNPPGSDGAKWKPEVLPFGSGALSKSPRARQDQPPIPYPMDTSKAPEDSKCLDWRPFPLCHHVTPPDLYIGGESGEGRRLLKDWTFPKREWGK